MSQNSLRQNKLTQEDIFYLKKKLQKSIDLPKSPNLRLKFIQISQPMSPNNPKNRPNGQTNKDFRILRSEKQIDAWINKKQKELTRRFEHQKQIQSQTNNHNLHQNIILLRKRVQTFPTSTSIQKQSQQKQQISSNQKSDFNIFRQQKSIKNNQAKKISKRKITELRIDECLTEGQHIKRKLTEKLDFLKTGLTPRFSKIKQQITNSTSLSKSQPRSYWKSPKGINVTNKGSNKQLSEQKFKNLKKKPLELDMSMVQQEAKLNFRYNLCKKSFSFLRDLTPKFPKKHPSPKSPSPKPFKSKLYDLLALQNHPIKKYIQRDLSPEQKDNLKNKYRQLQKRLNSILLSVKTER